MSGSLIFKRGFSTTRKMSGIEGGAPLVFKD